MLAQGQVSPADWVWHEDMSQWIPLHHAVFSAQPSIGFTQPPIRGQYNNFGPVAIPNLYLMPPDIHWIWLVVLGLPTLGIFPFIWFLRMTSFVRKLDPDETPMYLAILGFIIIHIGNFVRTTHSYQAAPHANSGLSALFVFGGIACYIVARFKMRRILLIHYNSIEPIGLYLSDVMTFFFGSYYLQYHFSRIARWKKTGYLRPQ